MNWLVADKIESDLENGPENLEYIEAKILELNPFPTMVLKVLEISKEDVERMTNNPVKLTGIPESIFMECGGIQHPEMSTWEYIAETIYGITIYKWKLIKVTESQVTLGLLDEWEKTFYFDRKDMIELFNDINTDDDKIHFNYCHSITVDRKYITKIELIK